MAELLFVNKGGEKIKHCPECLENGKESEVNRRKFKEDLYIILCTDDECSYSAVYEGNPMVTKQVMVYYHLPDQLLEHMDIFEEDVKNITCMSFYDYFKDFEELLESELQNVFYLIDSLNSTFKDKICLQRTDFGREMDSLLALKQRLKTVVSALSPKYKASVRDAFAKIKDYNYPQDFVNSFKSKTEQRPQ